MPDDLEDLARSTASGGQGVAGHCCICSDDDWREAIDYVVTKHQATGQRTNVSALHRGLCEKYGARYSHPKLRDHMKHVRG